MKMLNRSSWIAVSLAFALPLCGCDAVQSLTGSAAKSLLDRASEELFLSEESGGELAGEESTTPSSASAKSAGGGGQGNVYYQYVDDSGSVRFVQDRSQIPAKFRSSAGRLELESRPANPPRKTASRSPRRDIWKEAAEAPWGGGGAHEVVMYTAPWCGVCRKAEAYFRREGVQYTAKDIEASDTYKRELVQKIGRSAVPVIEIDDQRLVGWDQRRVASLLSP